MYKMTLEMHKDENDIIEYLIQTHTPLPIVMQAVMFAVDSATSRLLDLNNEDDVALMKSAAQANGLSMQELLVALNRQKGLVERLAELFMVLETEKARLHLITALIVKLYTDAGKESTCILH